MFGLHMFMRGTRLPLPLNWTPRRAYSLTFSISRPEVGWRPGRWGPDGVTGLSGDAVLPGRPQSAGVGARALSGYVRGGHGGARGLRGHGWTLALTAAESVAVWGPDLASCARVPWARGTWA